MSPSQTTELWFEPHKQLCFFLFLSLSLSFPLPFQFFLQWMPTEFNKSHSFWVGQYRGIFSSRSCNNIYVFNEGVCNNCLISHHNQSVHLGVKFSFTPFDVQQSHLSHKRMTWPCRDHGHELNDIKNSVIWCHNHLLH